MVGVSAGPTATDHSLDPQTKETPTMTESCTYNLSIHTNGDGYAMTVDLVDPSAECPSTEALVALLDRLSVDLRAETSGRLSMALPA